MADVLIYTANMGAYDTPRDQAAQDIDVDWYYIADDRGVGDPGPSWVWWRWTPAYDDANLAAKWFKCCPPFTIGTPHRYAIWIDASIEITSASFARDAIAAIHDGLAVFAHPRRSCIYTEVEASLGAESQDGKYDRERLTRQSYAYSQAGYPERNGLYACGIIAWDLHDERAMQFGRDWYRECVEWSPQDQVSFPVVCWRAGIVPGVFPIPLIRRARHGWLENEWLRIHPHVARAAT